jgi:hypothetical protein
VTVRQVRSGVADNNGDVTINLTVRTGQIFAAGDKVSAIERAANGTKVSTSRGSLNDGGAVGNNGNGVPFRSGATEETSLAPAADCDECASALLPGHSNVSLIILVLLMISTGGVALVGMHRRLRRPV